ncbi:hypothetical protein ROR02_15180 [Pararhodospirillum oryzae]|uniref:Uncharacterized protein n=1 Tax=Pararhodospirillum oryzae TaxID=478448 RepID=A0A512H7F7_9PROT|nr:hypothetical protein ROR02_15180 [Pararhodospirillum oryzae]
MPINRRKAAMNPPGRTPTLTIEIGGDVHPRAFVAPLLAFDAEKIGDVLTRSPDKTAGLRLRAPPAPLGASCVGADPGTMP